ncbi:aminopeptidase [Martiniozyma asiatica (nom. inval.)]|nr:aminopeptidase [Martiniozyma asiatica]
MFKKILKAGQPIFETRPHLVPSGHITPGITAIEYFNRREKLASKLPNSSLAIIKGSNIKFASGSVFYPFQQNNNLFYLSGWNEPDSCGIIEKDESGNVKFHMIVPPHDPAVEQWEGERTGVENVQEIFNADIGISNLNLNTHLQKLLATYKNVYCDIENRHDKIEKILRENGSIIYPLKNLVESIRIVKSNAELRVMRQAGRISGEVYNAAYGKKFSTEKGLAAFLEYGFIMNGCDKNAYVPVVAGGDHALCIHYVRNDDKFKDDNLVLVDAAGSLGGYCSDISRTWPVNGKFTNYQRDLYEAVLEVQKRLINECMAKNGHSLNDLHNLSVNWMTESLKNVGFSNLQSWECAKYLYPHYVGHNLGLDVHDCPTHSRNAKLLKGQVITIEPGVYIPDDPRWPKEFRGIGIRIEDDVAVGETNYVVLTKEAAKEVDEIESIAREGGYLELEEEVVDIANLLK